MKRRNFQRLQQFIDNKVHNKSNLCIQKRFMPITEMYFCNHIATYFEAFEQQQHVFLLPVLQQHESHLHSAPHFVVAHLQSKWIENHTFEK